MKQFLNLFAKTNYEEFLRCFVFDEYIEITHIKSKKIINFLKYDFIDKNNAIAYFEKNLNIPIELVISNKTMSCKSISTNNLSQKEIKALAQNILNSKSSINTVCYEKKFLNKNKKISICDFELNPIITKIIQELLSTKNHIISFSCWPVWIVDNYFKRFPDDHNKFKTSIFIVENKGDWEIIVLHNEKFVCYRRGNIENFSENIEIENTIKHISQITKVKYEDIAIYSINRDTIDKFIFNSTVNMDFISKSANLCACNNNNNIIILIRTLSSIIFLLTISNTSINIVDIFKINNKIQNSNKIINSIDKSLLSEIALWKDIQDGNYITQHDFRIALTNYIDNKKINRLQNASLKVNRKTNELCISVIQDDEKI